MYYLHKLHNRCIDYEKTIQLEIKILKTKKEKLKKDFLF